MRVASVKSTINELPSERQAVDEWPLLFSWLHYLKPVLVPTGAKTVMAITKILAIYFT